MDIHREQCIKESTWYFYVFHGYIYCTILIYCSSVFQGNLYRMYRYMYVCKYDMCVCSEIN